MQGFDLAAQERLLIAGTHLPFPTFGNVANRNGAYEWVQEEWQHVAAGIPWTAVV